MIGLCREHAKLQASGCEKKIINFFQHRSFNPNLHFLLISSVRMNISCMGTSFRRAQVFLVLDCISVGWSGDKYPLQVVVGAQVTDEITKIKYDSTLCNSYKLRNSI